MYLLKIRNQRVISFALLFFAVIFSDCEDLSAVEAEIPIEGAVYHVHRPDGSHKTYLDIVIGHSFKGKLPDDISHITVTGPEGKLPMGREDFNYNPQWRVFWFVRPGLPEIGKYTFEVAGKNSFGSAVDIQKVNRTIPVIDLSKFKIDPPETKSCLSPVFSWPKIKDTIPLYYQLEVRDINRKHLFRTGFIKDMTDVRIPPDILKSGMKYQWRVRVADKPDWVDIDNRSQSHWVTKSRSKTAIQCEYRYRAPRKTDDEWELSSLSGEGIDPVKITAMMKKLINGDIPNIDSVLIVKNGRLVLEEYLNGYAMNAKHHLMSVSKSVTSILVGIARDQGKIDSVDTKLHTLFPSYSDINWEGFKKEIRLKHVLTMSAGLDWNAWEYRDEDVRNTTTAMTYSKDWIKFTLEREALEPPGSRFLYNNGLSLLLGEILKKTTDLSADDFAAEYLFGPLEISDFNWRKVTGGIVDTAGGAKLIPRDMAKIGYMMLKEGKYNGQRIVSSEWVRESTRAHRTEDILLGGGYGYQWWYGRAVINSKKVELFYAAGKGGQYIFVVPKLDLVAVFTSKTFNNVFGEFWPQTLMVTYILPAMLPSAPPREPVKLDLNILETYVGDYEFQKLNIPVNIFIEDGNLFFRSPDKEKESLFPQTETRFFGTSNTIGDFQLNFIKDKKGETKHFVVQVGFGYWRFDRTKN